MINNFKTETVTLTTADQDIYTAPFASGDVAIVLLAQAANVSEFNASVFMSNGSAALVSGVVVPENAALGLLDGKLVLESGQIIKARANVNSAIQLTVSVLEMIQE